MSSHLKIGTRLAIAALTAGAFAASTASATTTSIVGNPSNPLGVASNFNVFVLNDMKAASSDVEGRVAVGGNATLRDYSIGQLASGGNALVVGRNLNFTRGTINGGGVAVGGQANLSNVSLANVPGGLVQSGTGSVPVNFNAAAQLLRDQGVAWQGLTTRNSNSVTLPWGETIFSGSNSDINVFNISAANLSRTNSVRFHVPSGSTALVNVSGTSVQMQNMGFALNGASASRTLFNFANAQTLTLGGIGVPGTIFAPNADVLFNNGVINGQLIAKSFTGGGQVNNVRFSGNIPVNVIPLGNPAVLGAIGLVGVIGYRRIRRRA